MSSKLLISTKSLVADPNAPNIRNQLQQAARAVTESINHLITVCTVSAPGQKECDNALRQMQAMRPLLEEPNEPINEASYFECLEGVINRSKALGEAMTGITNSSKQTQLDDFCDNVRHFADSVCGLTENTAQAAYLVGIADSASEPGRPGLVDQSLFARANQAIQMACESLTNPASSQQQVLSAATVVAKHTSTLCNTCRLASSKTSNPVAKRHFVQSAKDVANSTANLVRAIKALDSDFTDENRRKCADASKPLLQAVDELTTFASSPEFASVPAKISIKARNAQLPITSAGKALLDGACHMIMAAKDLAVKPRDPPTYQLYSKHSHAVSDAIKKLVGSLRECAPGQKECDTSIERVNGCIRDLDQASLAAVSQSLEPMQGNSMKGYQDQVITSARELLDLMDPLKEAAKGEAEKLGHLVKQIASFLEPLTKGSVGCASKTINSKQQMAILDQAKTVSESALQMLIAAKEGGGNPRSVHAHNTISEACDGTKEMLQELIANLEDALSASGHLDMMVESISKSMNRAEEHVAVPSHASYVDYQTNMVRLAKQIARAAQDMVGKSGTSLQDLGILANALTRDYDQLSGQMRGAVATVSHPDVGRVIRSTVQDLGSSCIDLVRDAGNVQASPSDSFAKKELVDHAKKVNEKVAHVLAALQAGARGTQACINAASTVSGIIGDLDTTIMFATAGTLNAEGDESFSDHRESILKTAKALVEDTKTLVAGAASNQEQLAQAAQGAVMTITRLAECVKQGAASLSSEQPEAQVLLINAVKDVASALADLISATKNASGKSATDPSMSTLKDSAKVMVTNVTSLLKTVKTVEDEAARGTQALESSIEAIGQEIKTYVSTDRVEKKYAPEVLIRATKPITMATAKAVAAGQSCRQEDVISASNMGRKAISDLLKASKGVSASADTRDMRHRVLNAGRTCGEHYKQLLEQVNTIIARPTTDNKQRLAVISKSVATSVTEIVHTAEAMKGSDWVDPEDPRVIAEQELLGAANSIEAAAKKLAQLQPRAQPKTADESLNFDEQILEAAKSIAAATAALVKAASAAQRELVAQGRIHSAFSDDEDDQWSQGLISAARMVAVATHSLCEAANAMVQGQGSEEKLISAAKQVASSTAQLLVACQVKADRDSVAMRRLQAAGNAVKRATEALVRAAQQFKEEGVLTDDRLTVNERMVGGIAQIIQAQEAILIKEKELDIARRKLETIRKAKYKDRPNTSEEEDSGSAF